MIALAVVVILSSATFLGALTPLTPESSCQDLRGSGCVNDTAQCCFEDNDFPGSFVFCSDNQFVVDHCGGHSTCNELPDIGNVECVDKSDS